MGTLLSSEDSLFIQVRKKDIFLILCYYFISYFLNITLQSFNLFSKTTQCTFKDY